MYMRVSLWPSGPRAQWTAGLGMGHGTHLLAHADWACRVRVGHGPSWVSASKPDFNKTHMIVCKLFMIISV